MKKLPRILIALLGSFVGARGREPGLAFGLAILGRVGERIVDHHPLRARDLARTARVEDAEADLALHPPDVVAEIRERQRVVAEPQTRLVGVARVVEDEEIVGLARGERRVVTDGPFDRLAVGAPQNGHLLGIETAELHEHVGESGRIVLGVLERLEALGAVVRIRPRRRVARPRSQGPTTPGKAPRTAWESRHGGRVVGPV